MNKEKKISYLVLIRHGQSEWNEQNLFTGWKNPPLTEKGIKEAENAGEKIKSLQIVFSHYFTSALIRAQETGEIILNTLQQKDLIKIKDQNLNERDYGDLSGLNKDEARKEWGEDQVHIWRRSYDTPPPGGESLKDTSMRVLPYFETEIKPLVKNGNNVLIDGKQIPIFEEDVVTLICKSPEVKEVVISKLKSYDNLQEAAS